MQFMMVLYSCFWWRLWIRGIFDSIAQFLRAQPRKPKQAKWQHENDFVFQNPPASLKASESLLKSHWREMRRTQNSAAGWLGMLILKMYPVFIRQELKDSAPWGQCLYLIQNETSVLLSLILVRDVQTSLMRDLWIQGTNGTARWAVEWFRGSWVHWEINCPSQPALSSLSFLPGVKASCLVGTIFHICTQVSCCFDCSGKYKYFQSHERLSVHEWMLLGFYFYCWTQQECLPGPTAALIYGLRGDFRW